MSTYKETLYGLRLTDFTCFEHLRPGAVLDIFQDLATQHSIETGIGYNTLREKNLIWVVVRQKFQFFPEIACKPHQQVRACTWPHSPSRLSFLRDYALYDEKDNLLAKGTSEWLLLDTKSKSFASILDNYQGPRDFRPERAFEGKEGKLKKLKDFEAPQEPAQRVVPQFSDMDFNMHINNARYADYIMNAVRQQADRPLRSLQIDYRKELLEGQTVSLFVVEDEDFTRVKGINEEGDISFNCLLGY